MRMNMLLRVSASVNVEKVKVMMLVICQFMPKSGTNHRLTITTAYYKQPIESFSLMDIFRQWEGPAIVRSAAH